MARRSPSIPMTLQNILKRGFSPTAKSLNLLVLYLLKSQRYKLVLHIFSQFSSTSIGIENPSTNYLIARAMLRCGRLEEAERFMTQKERSDIFPSKRLWGSLVREVCVGGKNPERAFLLLRDCVRGRGMLLSSATFKVLVSFFCSVGDVEGARKVVELMISENGRCAFDGDVCSWIVGLGVEELCKHGSIEKAIGFLSEVDNMGLELNFVAYSAIMRGLKKLSAKEEIEGGILKLLSLTEKLDTDLQTYACNESVIFLCKEGCVEAALHVCLMMRREDLIVASKSYRAIIKRLINAGMVQVAQLMLSAYVKEYGMLEHRMIDTVSFYLCMKSVVRVLDFINKIGVTRMPSSLATSIVDSLKKNDRVQEACKFIVEAKTYEVVVNVVAYSIVVDGLCKLGNLEKALELCEVMKKSGTHPNIVTYNSIINGLCQQGCLVEAFRLFNSLEQHNLIPTVITYGTMIDALSREGFLEDANQLFKRMFLKNVTPNTHIYNSLIYGYCSFGLMKEGLKFLHNLELNHLQPDAFTVSSLLGGFYVKGDMESALGFYNEYSSKGISPDFLGFSCLIKGLCAKGRMEEARGIFRDMLQCQSITCLIDRAGDGINIGSLRKLLINLCEEGSIKDAINLLSEISYLSFPSARYRVVSRPKDRNSETERLITSNNDSIHRIHSTHTQLQKLDNENLSSNHAIANNADVNIRLCNIEKECKGLGIYGIIRSLPSHDFGTYYSVIASLCSKGELETAKSMVKEMLLAYGESC